MPGTLVELLTQIARCLGLQQQFDEAHALLDRADAILAATADGSAAGGALETARARSLLERGRVYNSSGARERAAPLFHDAYLAALALGADDLAIDAAHMLEIVGTGTGRLEWNARAVAHAEASSDPRARRWLGALYNNRGWTLHELGRLDEALAAFEMRLAWLEQNPPPDGSGKNESEIGVAHWSIAKMFRLLGRVEEALDIQRRLAQTQAGDRDGYVHEELGECLLALGRSVEARASFEQAHALLSEDPWLRRSEPERLERLGRLAAGT